jgi:hypothetical protein
MKTRWRGWQPSQIRFGNEVELAMDAQVQPVVSISATGRPDQATSAMDNLASPNKNAFAAIPGALPPQCDRQLNAASQTIGIEVERHGSATTNDKLAMTTFCLGQQYCLRHARNTEAATFNFTSQNERSIFTIMFTKREKSDATILKCQCSGMAVSYRFIAWEA